MNKIYLEKRLLVLNACLGKYLTPTEIFNDCKNISFPSVFKHLKDGVKEGLLTKIIVGKRGKYTTSTKGFSLIKEARKW